MSLDVRLEVLAMGCCHTAHGLGLLCVMGVVYSATPCKDGRSRAIFLVAKAYTLLLYFALGYSFSPGPLDAALAHMPSDGWMLYALKFVRFVDTREQWRALSELLKAFPGLVTAPAESGL